MFTTEEKVRITNQVCELWARDMAPHGNTLLAVRFDNSEDPRVADEDEWYPESICLIFKDDGYGLDLPYVYTWARVDYDEDTDSLDFTEDAWESWSESGVEPYRCTHKDYMANIEKNKVEHPEWDTLYIKTDISVSMSIIEE